MRVTVIGVKLLINNLYRNLLQRYLAQSTTGYKWLQALIISL